MNQYLGELVLLVFGIYCLIGLFVFVLVTKYAKGSRNRVIRGFVVIALVGVFPAYLFIDSYATEKAVIARNKAAQALFDKHCKEDARITIKRVVENVDGVFIMKPRKKAEPWELQDQYWTGDPYGYADLEVAAPQTLLYDSLLDSRGRPRAEALAGYKFVEMPNTDDRAESIVRISGAEPTNRGYAKLIREPVENKASSYGFDWEDISTREDRKYWIAGGRTRVIDLGTGEVIAERVGYLIDPMQGGRVGGATWQFSNSISCPKFENDWAKTHEFLAMALKSSKGLGYANK